MAKFSSLNVGDCFLKEVRHKAKDRFGLKTTVIENVVFRKQTPSTGLCMRPDPSSPEELRRHTQNTLIILRPDDEVINLGIMEAASL